MARRILLTIIAAAAAVAPLCAEPAVGQAAGGGKRPAKIPDRVVHDSDEARRVMNGFADCVLRSNQRLALEALANFPNTRSETALFRKLLDGECLWGGNLTFKAPLFRGSLYAALYKMKFSAPPALPPVSPDFAAGAPQPLNQKASELIARRQYADCVVRADTADAHVAVVEIAGSDRESEAYARLAPHLSACLPQGLTAKFSKAVLGGLLAEVLYRDATEGTSAVPAEKN